jgi:hypothetical protein
MDNPPENERASASQIRTAARSLRRAGQEKVDQKAPSWGSRKLL